MIDPINIDERSSFSIQLEINGDSDAADKPIVRFNLINENFRLVFDAERIDNGVYEINIPELKNILKVGEYVCEFDVFLGNKHFTPITEKIKLIETVKPTMKIKSKTNKVTEDVISVKVIPVDAAPKSTLNVEKLDIISK